MVVCFVLIAENLSSWQHQLRLSRGRAESDCVPVAALTSFHWWCYHVFLSPGGCYHMFCDILVRYLEVDRHRCWRLPLETSTGVHVF